MLGKINDGKKTNRRERKKSLWGTFELNSSSDLNCFCVRFDNILVSTNLKSLWISKQCKKYHHHHHHHHNKPLSQACTASKFNVYPRKKHIVDANFLCCQLLDSKRKRRKRKPNRIKHKNKRQWKWEWEWVKENEKENVLECHRSFCYFITKQVKNQYCKNFLAIKPPTLFSHAYEPNVCSLCLSSHSLRSFIREAWASSEHFAMWLRHTVWRAIQSIRITVRMDVNFVGFFLVFARFFFACRKWKINFTLLLLHAICWMWNRRRERKQKKSTIDQFQRKQSQSCEWLRVIQYRFSTLIFQHFDYGL